MAVYSVLALCLLSISGWAQSDRYMVFFKDKNGTPHSVSQPSTFLSSRSLTRRAKAQVSVVFDDLPVTPSYVSQVRASGAKTFFTSRWMNAVLIEATPAVKNAVGMLSMVASVEKVAPNPKLLGGRQAKGMKTTVSAATIPTDGQLAMLGIAAMHAEGLKCEGIVIALCDSGFPGVNTTAPFQPTARIQMTADFITNSSNVYQFHDHGTIVLSTIAAQSSAFTGGATMAGYLLFVTEDAFTEYRIEEYNWLFAAEKADSAGADIIQSSLGYNLFDDPLMDYKISDLNGTTAVISRAASLARDRGIIVVTSAGNEGASSWRFVTPPADADGILAVGAVNLSGAKVSFSSVGPTTDGRIKPDVAALGAGVSVITSAGQPGTSSGTSLAAPLITSLVAGLLQAYPQTRPSELVEAIKHSSSQGANPDNSIGFGIPNFTAVRNYLEASRPDVDLYLHPNPSSGTVWITHKNLPEGAVDVVVYTPEGKVMLATSITISWLNNPLPISVGELSPGLYLIQIKTAGTVATLRFVKH
mgnify:CR=1 FL=1